MLNIAIAKLNTTVPVDFNTWSQDAMENCVKVGLGRILNDSVAGVARKDFDSDEAFRSHAMRKINIRLANLRNADRSTSSDPGLVRAREIVTKGGVVSDDEMAAMLAALEAHRAAQAKDAA